MMLKSDFKIKLCIIKKALSASDKAFFIKSLGMVTLPQLRSSFSFLVVAIQTYH